jgi:hypothetical protein
MRAYKIEMLVIDFDQLGERAIIETIETTRYPNHCISPSVRAIECRDIGLWDDNHPLNNKNKADAEYARLFAPAAQPVVLSDEQISDLKDAIGETEYKYFGCYEFSESQHTAVDVLVEVARMVIAAKEQA